MSVAARSAMPLAPSAPRPAPRRATRAYAYALLLLAPLNLMFWLIPATPAEASLQDLLNATAPVLFIAILAMLAFRILRIMPAALWSGAFWFPVQSAVFFGFGPLVEIYGNEITQAVLASHSLGVTETELFRAHKLSISGVTLVLFGFWLHMRLRPAAWMPAPEKMMPSPRPDLFGLAFVVLGGALTYLVLMPVQWGLLNIVVPGVITGVASIIDVGFAIMAFCAASGDRRQRLLFWVFWPLHLFLSVLTLSKLALMMAMLLPLIGAFLAHRRRARLGLGILVLALAFAANQPFVKYGRDVIMQRSGTISQAGYGERVDILAEYVASGGRGTAEFEDDGNQGWWSRLSFAGPQARAMALYDEGHSARVLHTAWMYFIPRAIWADKPIMVGPGLAFYRLVSGNTDGHSFLGLSIYGDLYWQYGWWGILLGCPLIGWLFGLISAQSIRAIEARNFLLMPAVLMAMQMALLSPNRFVINGIIGLLPIYLAYYVAFSFLSRFLSRRGR